MRKFTILMKRLYQFLFPPAKTGIIAFPALPETVKPVSVKPKSASKEEGLLTQVENYLQDQYEFRFNSLSEVTEFRRKKNLPELFTGVNQRVLNGLCLELHRYGIDCWDRDVSRYINSTVIPAYHPIQEYMKCLPQWDGIDRVTELAKRVSDKDVWIRGFHRWLLGVAAQWSGINSLHANSVAPVLISTRQGLHKSTFCKLLVPEILQNYYTDSFDLSSVSGAEQKLSLFGLINLDEFDKFSAKKMALLKNLMQMAGLNIRKAYKKNYSSLPRIASFIATSNQRDLLTDPSGSRRFLCVDIDKKIDCSPIDHLQLYAQLKTELVNGERYWFTNEEEAEIMTNNAPYRKRGMEEDLFYQCFRLPEKGEEGQLLSATEIYSYMKEKQPAVMREVSINMFGRLLTTIGLHRIHTRRGSRYHLVTLK